MLEQQKISLLTVRNQLAGGYMRRSYVLCLVVMCVTALAFVWMVRSSLCELHIKQGDTELIAYLAYEVEHR